MSSPLYAFEITLQARPAEATAGAALTDAWGTWPTLEVPKAALATPLAVGFDAALERLGAIERLYAEPDGSFVWACSRSAEPADTGFWQVDGNAAERDGRLLLVDLKGSCPAAEFDRLLEAFGWPEQPVMMQLVRAAAFLDEATFRRHATARGLVGDGKTLRPT
jgi:hypothetical protein